jgi:hypothetical protein
MAEQYTKYSDNEIKIDNFETKVSIAGVSKIVKCDNIVMHRKFIKEKKQRINAQLDKLQIEFNKRKADILEEKSLWDARKEACDNLLGA